MEAVIFIGAQGAGKSTFYQQQFGATHLRINLDMLRTRHRERVILKACLDVQQSFVVDNTNPTVAERAVYVNAARAAGFRTVGYYFQSRGVDCIKRNAQRTGAARVPDKAIFGTLARLQLPTSAEGFDMLQYVYIDSSQRFVVAE